MCKRHVFKGIVLWSLFLGVLSGAFTLLGFGSWFILSPNRGTIMGAVVIPTISVAATVAFIMLLTGFVMYLLYHANTTVWNTVHKNKEGILKLIPDVLGFLINYGIIGLEWENRGKEEEES